MRHVIRWSPCLILMAAIFIFSSRTGDDLHTLLPFFQSLFPAMEGFDWGHFVAYFALSLTFLWGVGQAVPSLLHRGLAIVLCLAYGLTDEYHQTFVAGRMADWHDIRNDGIGAFAGMVAISLPPLRRMYAKLPHARKY